MRPLVFAVCLSLLSVFTAVSVNAGYNKEEVFAPSEYCGKVWVKSHSNKYGKWVRAHWKYQHWVEGHYSHGKWVPGHCH